MPTLATTVDGLKLPNPFVIGSGPPGTNGNVIGKAFDEGWGAVICKTLSLDASKVVNVQPRYARLRARDSNEIIGWDIPTWDETNPTVWLLVRQPQTTNYTRVEIPLQWDEAAADWKLVAASGFANNTDPDLDRYTRFFDSQGGNE